ncbi:nucleotidyl transferase AbiEii/AbiGii toxin family protein [Youngiibacter multivorans]|uniref:Nucleotidyltransferase component of viral defense system n=1 Tax=Youngiibacter multivorans TaxID=937251 RepID=A0ABS4G042_9CLOT|nr:nucleotidyl transferase AbiEii/AbiGii toxin family protein [Youngiibacter multivorans]MBP1917922.1 putative nucleotidyltransferase component of viral defense system [Youngiibacter multivorans]
MPDVGASILAKLKYKSKTSGVPYQQYLQLFFQEEFLRRLSKSKYSGNLILKGGLFIFALTNFKSRATVDVDFLLDRINGNADYILNVINEIIETQTGYNKVIVLKASKTVQIAIHQKYPGVGIQVIGQLKNVRVPFGIDIGIGDIIVPKSQKMVIQTQLDGYDSPEVLTYSLESTISEKFDAILQRLELTSRMKDFFDIHYLAHTFDFSGYNLQLAIEHTLRNRNTYFGSDSLEKVVSLKDNLNIKTRWKHFTKTINSPDLNFSEIIGTIETFLSPVWEAVVSGKVFSKEWNCKSNSWQ